MDHQIFYLIKYIQEMHLILKCLSLSQMNRHRKEEVWQMQSLKKAKHLWLFLIYHLGGVFRLDYVNQGQFGLITDWIKWIKETVFKSVVTKIT